MFDCAYNPYQIKLAKDDRLNHEIKMKLFMANVFTSLCFSGILGNKLNFAITISSIILGLGEGLYGALKYNNEKKLSSSEGFDNQLDNLSPLTLNLKGFIFIAIN